MMVTTRCRSFLCRSTWSSDARIRVNNRMLMQAIRRLSAAAKVIPPVLELAAVTWPGSAFRRQLDEDVHEEPRQPPRPMLSKKRSSLAATLHNVFSGDDVDEEESVVFRSLSSYSSLPVFRSISTQEPQSVERGPSVSRGGSITFAGEGRRSRLTRALFAGPQKTPRYSKTPPFSLITCRRPHRARLPHLECERDEDQRRRCAKVDHIGRQSRRLFCRIPGTP